MNENLYLEKADEFFETNKDNLYLFSVESLYTVENPDIVQISIQRILNENISDEDFIFSENKIIAFLEYLYIKSEKTYCYSTTNLDGKALKKHKKIKESGTFINHISSRIDSDEHIEVEDINVLRGFAITGVRFGTVYFHFENPNIEVQVDNCQSFFVKFKDNKIAQEFITAAYKLGINSDKLNLA